MNTYAALKQLFGFWSFQNEQIDQGSEVFNEYTDSQEVIDSFVKAQKRKHREKDNQSYE